MMPVAKFLQDFRDTEVVTGDARAVRREETVVHAVCGEGRRRGVERREWPAIGGRALRHGDMKAQPTAYPHHCGTVARHHWRSSELEHRPP
jgi:hypothetical protein